jgi:hypothetical protein
LIQKLEIIFWWVKSSRHNNKVYFLQLDCTCHKHPWVVPLRTTHPKISRQLVFVLIKKRTIKKILVFLFVTSFIVCHLGCFCFVVFFFFSSSKLHWNCYMFWKWALRCLPHTEQWNFTNKTSSIHVSIKFNYFLLIYSFLQLWSNILTLVFTTTRIAFESSIFTITCKYDRGKEVHVVFTL